MSPSVDIVECHEKLTRLMAHITLRCQSAFTLLHPLIQYVAVAVTS
jgi:hypothetical protein